MLNDPRLNDPRLASWQRKRHAEDMITLARSPVHSDPELMGGTLVFQGTRVPAQTLLDYVQDGYDLDGFLLEFPSVDRQDAEEFLRLVSSERAEP